MTAAERHNAQVQVVQRNPHGKVYTVLRLPRNHRQVLWWSIKSTFRDRCRRSESLYVQISWQVQCFGHGGGLRGALFSWQVQ